ncbi:glycerol-3-phosphate acyltransferase [Bacillus sp. ISL-47]|uniref:glycerol-3-phosphate acyltransferase n=1 Tax=Bacillus sp. ISL-47 TaxID=2819130 RepID=UPI001BE510AD|nr:glycerol-3-phosphate acyltransferase [Bacillus sp. ISL-47]MBT2686619.1 glycerol-3-phosphate acyltransferase [Bacillus sp. ISL-47]MBT2707011.1 glycerol-3-phosphate acyltransferase [Pseudomonas sp. ISL-84]
MNDVITALLVMIVSYSMGSITGAYYVVKFFLKDDIRYMGSGNVGATNAGRALGKKGFLLSLAIDACKVWVALLFTNLLAGGSDVFLILSSLFVLLGHLFPLQLRFHGGKGVVAYLAAALFLEPIAILIMGITMGVTYMVLRKYTLAGFISMAAIPLTAWMTGDSFIVPAGLLLLLLIVFISHTHFFSRQPQS